MDPTTTTSAATTAATEPGGWGEGGSILAGDPVEEASKQMVMPDLSNFSYPGEVVYKPVWEIALKTAFYVPLVVLAVVGNVMVVAVVARDKRMRTTTNFYIVNLAVADCLVTLSCSWVHLLDDLTPQWVLGAFFCKFNTFAQVLTLVASILTLTFIACDRFFGIVFSMKAHFIERRASLTIVILWVLALAVASPLLVYRELFTTAWKDYTERWCDDNWPVVQSWDSNSKRMVTDQPARRAYYVFVCVVLFFLPCLVMSLAYALISRTLWSARRVPGERAACSGETRDQTRLRKKIIVMLVLILVVFIVCWMPQMVSLLYSEFRSNRSKQLPKWYEHFSYFARYLAHLNSAINPVIYAGFNDNFQKGFLSLCLRPKKKCRYSSIVSRMDDSFQTSTSHITRV
ncbi:QRFP-like peptide receptor [Babylonia areolata]|uniref:QRFP-like peptide receptor n=1 Tax=Babylonia areolata TaxID=304850 RepID=UPI003FD1F8AF